ncbi:ABC transporter permease [Peptoniphilus sp. KCTC 25270]|uniref:ABC transporter permease n=1 Tax=Peptoniphilus sp. KCTC 25270 TaxID=2897414 RepID=UPI001E3993C6|nr:ABC transporter permease [Peptoniphilus sp. KCTC 25270]MCD1148011.1 ABC transporter permease [Peptoniphilus sp. KCTC 25270]
MTSLAFTFASILGITLLYAAPLIYTAMGGVLSENTGVVNIGLEGMMTIGALVGATVGFYTGNPWLAFLCGGFGGMSVALLHAVATIHFGADHVVSGTAINLLGPGLSIFLARIFFEGAAMTKPIPFENKMPRVLGNLFESGSVPSIIFNQYITVYIALILVPIVYFILYKTKLGLRMRSVGEHPQAAETLGIDVYKIKYIGVLASGFLAGLGGASLSLAVVANFRQTLVSGQGYIALAAVIFGGWKPHTTLLACLLFGAAQGLVVFLGSTGVGISSDLLNMLPYVITMIMMVVFVGEARGPKSNGIPYERNK